MSKQGHYENMSSSASLSGMSLEEPLSSSAREDHEARLKFERLAAGDSVEVSVQAAAPLTASIVSPEEIVWSTEPNLEDFSERVFALAKNNPVPTVVLSALAGGAVAWLITNKPDWLQKAVGASKPFLSELIASKVQVVTSQPRSTSSQA